MELYRSSPNEDVSGWREPAEVIISGESERGLVNANWIGKELLVKCPEAQRCIDCVHLALGIHDQAMDDIDNCLQPMTPNQLEV